MSTPSPTIIDALLRYEDAAKAVTRREMNRFIEEIRSKYVPMLENEYHNGVELPAYDCIEGPRAEGYTIEGAISRQVYMLAFFHQEPEWPTENLTEAERLKQVYNRDVNTIVDDFDPPLEPPCPEEELQEMLGRLKAQLNSQGMPEDVDLPQDFIDLMRRANRVNGAGVPSETSRLRLVDSAERQKAKEHYLDRMRSCWNYEVVAAWQLGRSEFRRIFYALCRLEGHQDEPFRWMIWDCEEVERYSYDSLAEFLDAETERILQGDFFSSHVILIYDEYPIL